MATPPLPARLRILVSQVRDYQIQDCRQRRPIHTQRSSASGRRYTRIRPLGRPTSAPDIAQGPPVGRLYIGADVYGVDLIVPPPQLELADMRTCKRHRLGNPRHVYQTSRQLSRRAVGWRRETTVQALRACHKRAADHRARLPRDHRVEREPRRRARRRLCHGPPERDSFLGLDGAAFARGFRAGNLRRHCPRTLHSHSC